MADENKAYLEASVKDVADAIREKKGEYEETYDTFRISDMDEAISEIRSADYYKKLIPLGSIDSISGFNNWSSHAGIIAYVGKTNYYVLPFSCGFSLKAAYYTEPRTAPEQKPKTYVNAIIFVRDTTASVKKNYWVRISDSDASIVTTGINLLYPILSTMVKAEGVNYIYTSEQAPARANQSVTFSNAQKAFMTHKLEYIGLLEDQTLYSPVLYSLKDSKMSLTEISNTGNSPLAVYGSLAKKTFQTMDINILNNIVDCYIIRVGINYKVLFSVNQPHTSSSRYSIMPWHYVFDTTLKGVYDASTGSTGNSVIYFTNGSGGKANTSISEWNVSLDLGNATGTAVSYSDITLADTTTHQRILYNTRDICDTENNVIIPANISLDEVKEELKRIYPYFNT